MGPLQSLLEQAVRTTQEYCDRMARDLPENYRLKPPSETVRLFIPILADLPSYRRRYANGLYGPSAISHLQQMLFGRHLLVDLYPADLASEESFFRKFDMGPSEFCRRALQPGADSKMALIPVLNPPQPQHDFTEDRLELIREILEYEGEPRIVFSDISLNAFFRWYTQDRVHATSELVEDLYHKHFAFVDNVPPFRAADYLMIQSNDLPSAITKTVKGRLRNVASCLNDPTVLDEMFSQVFCNGAAPNWTDKLDLLHGLKYVCAGPVTAAKGGALRMSEVVYRDLVRLRDFARFSDHIQSWLVEPKKNSDKWTWLNHAQQLLGEAWILPSREYLTFAIFQKAESSNYFEQLISLSEQLLDTMNQDMDTCRLDRIEEIAKQTREYTYKWFEFHISGKMHADRITRFGYPLYKITDWALGLGIPVTEKLVQRTVEIVMTPFRSKPSIDHGKKSGLLIAEIFMGAKAAGFPHR